MAELTKVRKSVMEESQVLPDMAGQDGKVLSNNGAIAIWVSKQTAGRIVGEIVRFSFDTPPVGFFALDGSRISNGVNDFSALANCGSRFITLSGSDLVLADFQDFGRGKGSSSRTIGQYEGDAIRNITGEFSGGNGYAGTGAFRRAGRFGNISYHDISHYNFTFDASRVVPVSDQNRPKSLTELVCIYHGVL